MMSEAPTLVSMITETAEYHGERLPAFIRGPAKRRENKESGDVPPDLKVRRRR
jgi:hypothetical protein